MNKVDYVEHLSRFPLTVYKERKLYMSDLVSTIPRNAALAGLIAVAIVLSMASCTGADSTPKPQATKSTYTIDQLNEHGGKSLK